MPAECTLDVCYGCMEKNKKSPRWGGEGWRPFVCVMPKSNGKQAPPLSFAITPTVTREARHSPPSPLRKKSRFAKKKSASPKKNCACGGGVGGCVGVGIEGRAQNIAPLHLIRCLIAGYNLVGALQGRAQNIAPLQVGGIVAVVAIDAIDAIDAIGGG